MTITVAALVPGRRLQFDELAYTVIGVRGHIAILMLDAKIAEFSLLLIDVLRRAVLIEAPGSNQADKD